jgi:hypothetical protein
MAYDASWDTCASGANLSRSPHFHKASLRLCDHRTRSAREKSWSRRRVLAGGCERPFGRFETISFCFGEDASQLTGSLTFIRSYVEAETRNSRRELADVDEGVVAQRSSSRHIASERSDDAQKESFRVSQKIHVSQSPMTVTITFRRCAVCRCSNRKIPCHVPSCIREPAIGITSLDRVNTIRMCEGMSSGPSSLCSK